MTHDLLILPAKPDPERDAVAVAWTADGGAVLRVDRFWERPAVDPARVALSGADTFCLVLAQLLGLELVSPADDPLLRACPGLLEREVRGATLGRPSAAAWTPAGGTTRSGSRRPAAPRVPPRPGREAGELRPSSRCRRLALPSRR